MVFGYSSIQWRYEWINLGLTEDIHGAVYHNPSTQRDRQILATRWNWNELAKFLRRLKATPDGTSNMLNNTLVYATSHFGKHHSLARNPLVLFGNCQGRLTTGRALKLSGTNTNAKALTSAARLCGVNISGFGDEPNSGAIPGIG